MQFSKIFYTASSAFAVGIISCGFLSLIPVSALAKAKVPAAVQQENGPKIKLENWGKTQKGKSVQRIILSNQHGVTARILTYGATLQSLDIPDAKGKSANVVLGFKDLKGYEATGPSPRTYFGATIGRVANRIPNGTFSLDGQTYNVPTNAGDNAIHGGNVGLDQKVWKILDKGQNAKGAWVKLGCVSPSGDQGFPGAVNIEATYFLGAENALTLEYKATTDKKTPLSMTNHTYWNLNGEGSGSIASETLQVFADRYTPTDISLIPTGHILPVEGSVFDYRKPILLRERLNLSENQMLWHHGLDENFVLNGAYGEEPRPAAILADPRSGRALRISTTEPGIIAYTGNSLDGGYVGTSGKTYRQTDGIALESGGFPDSLHHPNFPSIIITPADAYHATTVWEFGVIDNGK
ncbi:galactose mutarotase [Acetobacteraceae bacterium]|nr:galactose mutarotase [Acetobacteraceae bacterium]